MDSVHERHSLRERGCLIMQYWTYCSDDYERQREVRSEELFRAVARCNFCAVGHGMWQSLFRSDHVHARTTECGSFSGLTTPRGGHGAYGSSIQLQSHAMCMGGGAFRPPLARMGDHAEGIAMQTDGADGGCSLQVRSLLRSPPRSSPDTPIGRGQVHG